MAQIEDIASFVLVGQGISGSSTVNPSIDILINSPVYNINVPAPTDTNVIDVITAGPQGPPGVQNVYVQPTPPSSPQVNWIWVDTS